VQASEAKRQAMKRTGMRVNLMVGSWGSACERLPIEAETMGGVHYRRGNCNRLNRAKGVSQSPLWLRSTGILVDTTALPLRACGASVSGSLNGLVTVVVLPSQGRNASVDALQRGTLAYWAACRSTSTMRRRTPRERARARSRGATVAGNHATVFEQRPGHLASLPGTVRTRLGPPSQLYPLTVSSSGGSEPCSHCSLYGISVSSRSSLRPSEILANT